ncbi:MAG: dihydrodipicolinate reductase C-terminal domain-containing protein [Planctomycetota bacterium]
MVLRTVVIGARGRMGRFSLELLAGEADFAVAAALDAGDDLPAALAACDATLGLDFTVAGRGHAHGRLLLEAGLRPVIGTSGVSAAETADLDRLARARGLGGLVVPNFSAGMWVLQRAALLAAAHFPACEIVELHHERKRDAPSGTALDTAARLAAARGGAPAAIPIHSVRLPGLYAHQEVLFGAPGETLTLRHDMASPAAFGPGILAALRYAARAVGVACGLDAALGMPPSPP